MPDLLLLLLLLLLRRRLLLLLLLQGCELQHIFLLDKFNPAHIPDGMPSACCCCCCRVIELQHGFALVEFDALHEDEESNTLLREWFPLPGPGPAADPVAGAAAARGHHFHTDLTNMLRPKPPQEVCLTRRFM
jgi:hypothetical protein